MMESNNIENKKKLWKKVKTTIENEVGKKYEITVLGLDDDSIYFHPILKIKENMYLQMQCDTKQEKYYALYLIPKNQIDLYGRINIDLKTNSIKDALKIINKKKITFSVEETVTEISEIENSIKRLQELISVKIKLLNII